MIAFMLLFSAIGLQYHIFQLCGVTLPVAGIKEAFFTTMTSPLSTLSLSSATIPFFHTVHELNEFPHNDDVKLTAIKASPTVEWGGKDIMLP